MNKNDVITILYTAQTINNEVKNMCKHFSRGNKTFCEDLEQELYILLLQKDEQQLLFLHQNNQLLYYIFGLLQNQTRGTKEHSTHIYKNYGKWVETSDKNINVENTYLYKQTITDPSIKAFEDENEVKVKTDIVIKKMKEITKKEKDGWYSEELFKMYYESNLTYRQIEEKTLIPFCSVRATVSALTNKIKNELK